MAEGNTGDFPPRDPSSSSSLLGKRQRKGSGSGPDRGRPSVPSGVAGAAGSAPSIHVGGQDAGQGADHSQPQKPSATPASRSMSTNQFHNAQLSSPQAQQQQQHRYSTSPGPGPGEASKHRASGSSVGAGSPSYAGDVTGEISGQGQDQPNKVQKACVNCRRAKTKCVNFNSEPPCERCKQMKQACKFRLRSDDENWRDKTDDMLGRLTEAVEGLLQHTTAQAQRAPAPVPPPLGAAGGPMYGSPYLAPQTAGLPPRPYPVPVSPRGMPIGGMGGPNGNHFYPSSAPPYATTFATGPSGLGTALGIHSSSPKPSGGSGVPSLGLSPNAASTPPAQSLAAGNVAFATGRSPGATSAASPSHGAMPPPSSTVSRIGGVRHPHSNSLGAGAGNGHAPGSASSTPTAGGLTPSGAAAIAATKRMRGNGYMEPSYTLSQVLRSETPDRIASLSATRWVMGGTEWENYARPAEHIGRDDPRLNALSMGLVPADRARQLFIL